MNMDSCGHDRVHLLGESATHPIEPRCGTLAGLQAVLLLLAGMSQSQRLWPSAGTNSPRGLFVSRLSPQRRRALQAAAGEDARLLARHEPSSGRFVSGLGLASAPHRGPLGRAQLRFLG